MAFRKVIEIVPFEFWSDGTYGGYGEQYANLLLLDNGDVIVAPKSGFGHDDHAYAGAEKYVAKEGAAKIVRESIAQRTRNNRKWLAKRNAALRLIEGKAPKEEKKLSRRRKK